MMHAPGTGTRYRLIFAREEARRRSDRRRARWLFAAVVASWVVIGGAYLAFAWTGVL